MLNITPENFGEIARKLRAFFPEEEVLCRIVSEPKNDTPNGKGANEGKIIAPAAFYVDARSIMDRLDFVVGPHNWQDETTLVAEGAICRLGIKIDGEWVWKTDVSEYTDFEGTKGGSSKALVRAASRWGIGRYFYDVKAVWAPVEKRGRSWVITEMPKIPRDFLP